MYVDIPELRVLVLTQIGNFYSGTKARDYSQGCVIILATTIAHPTTPGVDSNYASNEMGE